MANLLCLQRVERSLICQFQCFCLFDIQQWSILSEVVLSASQTPPTSPPPPPVPLPPTEKDSAKRQLLRLRTHFSPKW